MLMNPPHSCLGSAHGSIVTFRPERAVLSALLLAACAFSSVTVAQTTTPPLLPRPQQITAQAGEFALCGAGIEIAGASPSSGNDTHPAQLLATVLSTLCGHPITVRDGHSKGPSIILNDEALQAALPGISEIAGSRSREAYRIDIAPTQIEIRAASSAGIDYGVETMLQLLRPLSPAHPALPAMTIDDWPSMAYRGLMIDTAHGARPTLAFMHRLLDAMEGWKLNQLYLYAETNLPFSNPTPPWHANAWSRDEIRDLVSYAAARHIDVVPCVEFYGHLHDLLTEESQSPLGAMPHGGELNPANPQTTELVSNWMHQLAELFPSPWLHMGFDEPFELDRMDAASRRGIPPDRLWSEHLRKSAELANSLGKKPMFWADIDEGAFLFNKYPQLAAQLPPEAVAVPWFYDARPDYSPLLALFKQYRVPLMVAPAVSDWDDVFPDYDTSFVNIQGMITAGRTVNATGAINTIWSDSALALHRTAWPGIAYGAAASWQSTPVPAQDFFALFAALNASPSSAPALASIYQSLTTAESELKESLGDEPAFRVFDMPFDASFLDKALAHQKQLIDARLHLESALRALQALGGNSPDDDEVLSLTAQARIMDYSALRALYAVEIDENFRALPAAPTADDLHYRLGWETASRNHSRVSDLIDRSGECLDAYRQAWLAESLPYRLPTAEARWQHEQQFWIDFQEKVWSLRREFKAGDPRPTLDGLLHRTP